MAVKFNDINQLTIQRNEFVTDTAINNILSKLHQNDIDISPLTDFSPKIWECTWFNVDQEYHNYYGYSKGDAVWYNTEDIFSFISKNSDLIYYYASNNNILRNIIKVFDPTSEEIFNLYVSIIQGYEYYDIKQQKKKLQPLFDIGTLTDDVQIYVSLVDKNTKAPSEDPDGKYWKKYIKHSNDKKIYENIRTIANLLIQQHIENYHLGQDKLSNSEIEAIKNKYVIHDLSNLDDSAKQKMTNITGSNDLLGYDQIKKTVTSGTNENNNYKWFREWTSGYLEHGGIINVQYNNQIVNINFDWLYSNDSKDAKIEKAPIYSYYESSESFYGRLNKFDTDKEYIKDKNLGRSSRYVVNITPYQTSNYPSGLTKNSFFQVEVTNIKNTGFSIKANTKGQYVYYVSGFRNVGV